METSTPQHDHVSSQTIAERSSRPVVVRPINVRINLRVLAGLGAGLIVLGAFLPWSDPAAQAALGSTRVAPVIQGWPSLLIGLIMLAVLALPQVDGSRWVSLPAAALGLAAAVIAVASAITTANAVAEVVLRFPTDGDALVAVTGTGVFVTIAGGLICVIAGLSRPPTLSSEARIDMQPGQPEFAVIASALVVVALIAGLLGAWIGSNGQRTTTEGQAAFPTDLLSTPVIDAQVTPLGPAGATVEPTPGAGVETPIPTPPPFETPLPPTRTLQPTFAPTLPPLPTETVASPLGTPTATEQTFSAGPATTTPTATFGPSPLGP